MDSSFEGFVLDPSKCSMLSMDEKRELVYEISKWSQGAPEMLQSWSRRELLEILCAEMGKERKYTGLTKIRMIEHLLKLVAEKKSVKRANDADHDSQPSSANNQNTSKRQRKTDNPTRLPVVTNKFSINDDNGDQVDIKYCQNSACRATLRQEDTFCKRCSCCICHQYDDNKDPSLWLVCSSESPYPDDSCGMSCHLECALKHEKAGIAKDEQHAKLDGRFCCVSCGKLNDLLGCWRKQLMAAKDTRRVDILCYRVSLSQKLLHGTEKYQKLHEIVCTAAKKLEADVGPLAGLPVKMARGIVNRLSSGPEVQKLCASAMELLDSMISSCSLNSSLHVIQECKLASSSLIRFENVSSTSLIVILGSKGTTSEERVEYTLWHRRADLTDYPAEPTCTLFAPNTRFLVSDLSPATEYHFKVVAFCDTRELERSEVTVFTTNTVGTVAKSLVEERSQSPTTNSSILSNPSSEVDESNNSTLYRDQVDNPKGNFFGYCMKSEINDSGKHPDVACKDINDSQNTSTGTEKEGTPGDSGSALDEERITGEVVSVANSEIKIENQRDSRNSTTGNQVSDVLIPQKHPPEVQLVERITENGSNSPVRKQMELVPFEGGGSDAVLPITPNKLEIGKEGPAGRNGRPKPTNEEPENRSGKAEETQAGSSSKKRSGARCDQDSPRDGSLEGDYEYCVKMIRWLECEGHIEKNFRVKFLTWYSLRATPQERKVVKVFVDTFMDDPAGLAGQLIDTFSEGISSKRPPVVPPGFCMKLWH